jgi:hypothetical protein
MALRAFALAATFAIALALWPAPAAAATTYVDTLSGVEYWASSTQGRFTGKATGQLTGYWNATVDHTPLSLAATPTATITGGSFALATSIGGVPTLVTGTFVAGGMVNIINSGANCTNQTFAVQGPLGNVGPWYSGTGSGTFAVTLTHYRTRVFGSCVTYSASVTGSLSLTF